MDISSKQKMKNFLNKALYGIFFFLLIGIVVLFLAPTLPFKSSVEIKIVKSGSMEPAVKTGSIVIIKSTGVYNIGDIITFGEDTPTNYPTTHRIVATKDINGETFYQVKGDANEEADPTLINKRDVIGKVIFTIPNAGYILDFARQPIGFILLIAFPAALVILNELVDIVREIRRTLRRRKDDQDDFHSDTTVEIVLKRSSQMDDVFRPMKLIRHTSSKKRRDPLIASVLILFVSGLIFTRTGATSSYFADNEHSLGNTMSAMSFEISANASPTESYVGHAGSSSVISTVTPNPVGLPNEYKVSVEKIAGSDTFCQALNMVSTSTPPFTYDGLMLNFVSPPTIFSGEWAFEVYLSPDAEGINSDDICSVNLVYLAKTWLEDKGVYGGYSDVEKVTLIFKFDEQEEVDVQELEFQFIQNFIQDEVKEDTSTTTSKVEQESTEEENYEEEIIEEESINIEVREEEPELAEIEG